MWLLVGRSGFAVVVALCPHPNLCQQPLAMWLLVRRSGFAVRGVSAGTGATCGPILVDLIELASIATTRTAAVNPNATRAATASLERLRALVS
jgi:hypothetical protein